MSKGKTTKKALAKKKAPARVAAKKKPVKRKGRPTKFTRVLAARICMKIAAGWSLRKICELRSMPCRDTVCKWLALDAEFSDQYARAARTRALACADDILDIADSDENPAVKRVRIDARKWLAARMNPKLYGDKVEVDNKGEVSHTFRMFYHPPGEGE